MADVRSYTIVTAAYWAFTLTDGALRMLVLLHFHALGYTPLDLAFLFVLYELMGIVTNFLGGWVGARFGLRVTLFAGIALQVLALLMLSAVDPRWTMVLSVLYVMAAQALSGIAKDLTKMSAKAAIKVVVEEPGSGLLFRWVALLTGSKNALKGVGFFLGGALLAWIGFQSALWSMAGMLVAVLVSAVASLRADLGKAQVRVTGRDLFAKTREINWLSAARVFLFASRDVWFVVGVPIFLYSRLGWSFDQVGAFMATWVIGYGVVQAGVPRALSGTMNPERGARAAKLWGSILILVPATLAAAMATVPSAGLLIGGLYVFGLVFAVNSALHSYLIVAYSDADKVALDVGFYYMANALGRLGGTLLSGLVYQVAGLSATLWASAAMVAVAVLFTLPLTTEVKSSTTDIIGKDAKP
jgi:predicted MFS family arabinose efflux permease